MSDLTRYLPWAALGVAVIYLFAVMIPPADPPDKMHLYEFSKLPVVDGGRVKPLDTVARNSLMVISSRQTYTDAQDNTDQPAIKWLLDTMTSGPLFQEGVIENLRGFFGIPPYMKPVKFRKDSVENLRVFRIENDQVLQQLQLPIRPGSYRYSFSEMGPRFSQFEQQVRQAQDRPAKERDLFDTKVLELRQHLELFLALSILRDPLTIPPPSGSDEWKSFPQTLVEMKDTGQLNPDTLMFVKILLAYVNGDTAAFNRDVAEYRSHLEQQLPKETSNASFEAFYNHFSPFYHCIVLYGFVSVLACLGFLGWILGWSQPINRAAFWLLVLVLVVHTWALLARMYIQGRPPVTNLYSSAVFIGWCSVILGLIIEKIYPIGIGNLIAGVLGGSTAIIAHHLSRSGDTLEMMQAVLDTNFWLATHVVVVTMGYSATMFAGLLGVLFIILRVFTPLLNKEVFKIIGQMIYGIVCFATLLSFTGTVLGGIWADQSWGRFWGWDPKENGALIIVIWNALLLHARWAGLVQQRGMAVLSIVGIIVTGWSWFGTNQLGVGLHAYGFNNTLAIGLRVLWSGSLAMIFVGVLPMGAWWDRLAARYPQVQPVDSKPRQRRDRTGDGISGKSTSIRTKDERGRIKR